MSRTVPPKPSTKHLSISAALEWRKRGEIDASAGLDVWDRESTERMADDDRVRLRPDLAGIVERR